MLTKSEKEWLKKREQWAKPHNGYGDEGYFCEHCKINCFDGCPTEIRDGNIDAFMDAAEFSERVAAKLATAYADYVKNRICIDFDLGMRCPGFQTCAMKHPHPPCDFAVLKGVRLQVEEEMDNANK